MSWLLLAVAGIGWWAWRTRRPQALRIGDVAAAIAALLALKLAGHDPLPALVAAGGVGWWLWFRRRQAALVAEPALSRAEAYRVLDLADNAPADQVRSAHRRLMTRLHPDNGGSAELAARVNAARDCLLARDQLAS